MPASRSDQGAVRARLPDDGEDSEGQRQECAGNRLQQRDADLLPKSSSSHGSSDHSGRARKAIEPGAPVEQRNKPGRGPGSERSVRSRTDVIVRRHTIASIVVHLSDLTVSPQSA